MADTDTSDEPAISTQQITNTYFPSGTPRGNLPTFLEDLKNRHSQKNPFPLPQQHSTCHFPELFYPLHLPDKKNSHGNKKPYSGDFDYMRRFQAFLDELTGEHSKKHGQTVGQPANQTVGPTVGPTFGSVLRMIGHFETLRDVVEYGTLALQMLAHIPVVRMLLDVFRLFWKYLKVVGRNGPLVGLFALICTYVGRACLPLIRDAVQELRGKGSSVKNAAFRRKVKFAHVAKSSDELTVLAGEQVDIIDEKLAHKRKQSQQMVTVQRVKCLTGQPVSGLIPKSALMETSRF